MRKLNKTDWRWEKANLVLRYPSKPIYSISNPMTVYASSKERYESLYKRYKTLQLELQKPRDIREPEEIKESLYEGMQEWLARKMDAERNFQTVRPQVKIAICPFCRTEVWQQVGLFTLSDSFWYEHESNGRHIPSSSICDHLFCITGALGLNGHEPTEQYSPPDAQGSYLRMAAEVPFVLPRLLDLGLTAVLHAIPIAEKYTAYPITYFTPSPIAQHEHFCTPWAAERFTGKMPDGSVFTGTRSDKQEYDLSDALVKEQLLWLDPRKQNKLISVQKTECPYQDVNGRQHPYKIENGIIHDLPNPQTIPPQIQ